MFRIIVTMGLACAGCAGQVAFNPVEALTGADTTVVCVSGDGRVVGGSVRTGSNQEAVVWVDGAAFRLGIPGAIHGLSNEAHFACGYLDDTQEVRAFVSQPPGPPNLLPDLPGPFYQSFGYGVSSGGTVVGSYRSSGQSNTIPVQWDASGAHPLGTIDGGQGGEAWEVRPDGGRAVGTVFNDAGLARACWWDAEQGLHLLPPPQGTFSQTTARDLGANGQVVVGTAVSGGSLPVRWVAGYAAVLSSASLGPPRVSDDGWRVVAGNQVWDPVAGWRTVESIMTEAGLNFPAGWVFPALMDISGDGTTLLGFSRTLEPMRFYGWTLRVAPFCYANCDGSTASPALNVLDFNCFLNRFTAADLYADCNLDGQTNILDFNCFLNRFVVGCP